MALRIFELDNIVWNTEGSVFERLPPFHLKGNQELVDSKGKSIRLDEHASLVFRFIKSQGDMISISRYYQEELIFDILHQFGLMNFLCFLTIEWDKGLGTFRKEIKNPEGNIRMNQEDISFINTKSAYFSIVGQALGWEGKGYDSLVFYEKAVELDQENLSALLGIALIFFQRHETGKALEIFDSLKEKMRHPAIPLCMARIYREIGDLGQSIKFYEDAVSQNPVDWIVYQELGELFEITKQYTNEYNSVLKAIENNPPPEKLKLFRKRLYVLTQLTKGDGI
ncbi:MAG: hypothetical protein ABIF10_01960 [Candidatus Woesearchaeota archaeon]